MTTQRLNSICLFGLLMLSACSTSEGSANTADSVIGGATAVETVDTFASRIPTVPDDQKAALIAELDAIAPGLATEPQDTIDNARNTCDSILSGSQKLVEATKIRFVGDGVDELNDEQAQQIVDVIASSAWCR